MEMVGLAVVLLVVAVVAIAGRDAGERGGWR